jgi:hypothetical protein
MPTMLVYRAALVEPVGSVPTRGDSKLRPPWSLDETRQPSITERRR